MLGGGGGEGVPWGGAVAILKLRQRDGMCDVYNPAAGLLLTVYHVKVWGGGGGGVGVPCLPPSDPGGPDTPPPSFYKGLQDHNKGWSLLLPQFLIYTTISQHLSKNCMKLRNKGLSLSQPGWTCFILT